MRLYHVTRKENLEGIMREGLTPHLDTCLEARFLPKEYECTNLIDKSEVRLLADWICEDEGDCAVLQVTIPRSRVRRVTHSGGAHWSWYITRDRIPPENLRVRSIKSFPWPWGDDR